MSAPTLRVVTTARYTVADILALASQTMPFQGATRFYPAVPVRSGVDVRIDTDFGEPYECEGCAHVRDAPHPQGVGRARACGCGDRR